MKIVRQMVAYVLYNTVEKSEHYKYFAKFYWTSEQYVKD